MSQEDTEFQKKLLATFKLEAQEHMSEISSGLIALEQVPNNEERAPMIERVFREVHSLKGAARAVNLIEIQDICQSVEDVFALLKRKDMDLSPHVFDTLHRAMDAVGELIATGDKSASSLNVLPILEDLSSLRSIRTPGTDLGKDQTSEGEDRSEHPNVNIEIERQTEILYDKTSKGAHQSIPPPRGPRQDGETKNSPLVQTQETIRISTEKLDALLLQAEEMLSVKLNTAQRAIDLREMITLIDSWKKQWSILYPEIQRLRQLRRKGGRPDGSDLFQVTLEPILEFLDWNHSTIKSFESKLIHLVKKADHDRRLLGATVDNFLDDVKAILMNPVSSLVDAFPKLVRDLARAQGKDVDLVVEGGEVEIDRRVIEKIKDPLVHLLRNAIDHGIEDPEVRIRKGKPARGRIRLTLSQVHNSKVEITISDDGAGIDIDQVKNAGRKRGILSKEELEQIDDQDALSLIFQSELSTSSMITDISGRGLGLAIVKERVEMLGGLIAVDSQAESGSSFRILLPVTLATFRGILIRVGGEHYIVPTMSVDQVVRIKSEEVVTAESKETLLLNGSPISFVWLEDVLGIRRNVKQDRESKHYLAMILGFGDHRIAFAIDEILSEQEVLVKDLGPQLSRVRNISGATVLGSGQVVSILNIPDLVKSAVRSNAASVPPSNGGIKSRKQLPDQTKQKSILVAEDSITSRSLMKNILESAGYFVKTTVDGADAFQVLMTEDFDLVVSDVEMPRMNGLDLTAKIRGDKKLSETPVVLVTGLESRQDRERGIDIGANAYIVKSSFDQSNLLEVIRKLI